MWPFKRKASHLSERTIDYLANRFRSKEDLIRYYKGEEKRQKANIQKLTEDNRRLITENNNLLRELQIFRTPKEKRFEGN